ncbi:unnamed protein product [Caenorhabditis bovis]|uniref:Uncharacterized protein n=1 Tax=Caenorhabditis bovis TaxID=2654633 RepID=A0A8S1EGC3_9PELO|nr:unnamed protein product [Caenorhabditis bovis]
MPPRKIASTKLAKSKQSNANYVFLQNRLDTFKRFKFDSDHSATCTSEKLAKAGFISTASPSSPTTAKCAFCCKELEFDPTDDPWEEHVKRGKDCIFVQFGQIDESDYTIEQFLQLNVADNINKGYDDLIELARETTKKAKKAVVV